MQTSETNTHSVSNRKHERERDMRHWLAVLVLTLAGCASGSAIVTGPKLPPTEPEQVQILLEAPSSEFEIIGLVEARSDVEFTRQAASDRAIEELKKQAAKIGANAVVLTGTGEKSSSVLIGGNTTTTTIGNTSFGNTSFYVIEEETIIVKGTAIFIDK